jgi:hypothetical protein
MRQGLLTREGRGTPTDDDLKRDSMKQRKNTPHSCAECLNKYKTGHDDGTEGLSHIWISETRTFTVCPTCDGSGQEPAR